MADVKRVEPQIWYTERQLIFAMVLAFLTGCGLTLMVLVLFNLE